MEVIGMVTDTAPSSRKGVGYGVFGRCGATAMVVEVLLGVGGFDVDRSAEMTVVNMDIDIQKSDVGGESGKYSYIVIIVMQPVSVTKLQFIS